MDIKEIAFHRNGVCGIGFHVVLFADGKNKNMVGIVFPEPGAVAVLDTKMTAKGNIAFARGNSWRGDYYESYLRAAIEDDENERPLGGTPFAFTPPDVLEDLVKKTIKKPKGTKKTTKKGSKE